MLYRYSTAIFTVSVKCKMEVEILLKLVNYGGNQHFAEYYVSNSTMRGAVFIMKKPKTVSFELLAVIYWDCSSTCNFIGGLVSDKE